MNLRSTSIFTEDALVNVVSDYIPYQDLALSQLRQQRHPNGFPEDYVTVQNDGESNLKAMLTHSDSVTKMYGSARELAENLKIYRNFSRCHKKFHLNASEPFNNVCVEKFQNEKEEFFICKQDLFVYLQSVIFAAHANASHEAPASMLMAILKQHEERLDGCCEFVKYDLQKLENIGVDTVVHMKQLEKRRKTFLSLHLSVLDKHFKKLIPNWNDADYDCVQEIYRKYYNSGNNSHLFGMTYILIKTFAESLQKTVNDYPELFLPYSQSKHPSAPITVRVFEDFGEKFVMKSELFNAINIRNPDEKPLEINDPEGMISTIRFEEVQGKYRSRVDKIEFICYPIKRAKHAAVPIMTPSGGHCILATDALLETLRPLIFCRKIFQKFNNETWHILESGMSHLETVFSPFIKSKYFITLEAIENYENTINTFIAKFEKVPAPSVRNAKPDGFTLQNLQNELTHLDVTDLFPEITLFADGAYKEVVSAKKERFLRTCDLFDAIEKCQVVCILNQFPNLKLFLHIQSSCHRVGQLNCGFCATFKQTGLKNTVLNDSQNLNLELQYDKSDPDNKAQQTVVLPNGCSFVSNLKYFTPEQIKKHGIKYFILENKETPDLKKMHSLKHFTEKNDENIHLRAIPSTKNNESRRVFTEEILETIPIVLAQQKTPLSASDSRLKKYENLWKSDDVNLYKTISIPEFELILEEFDVDKSRITIVPDPVYEIAEDRMLKTHQSILTVFSPRGVLVMRSGQAVFHVFQSVVCDVNWGAARHQMATMVNLKDRIIEAMWEFVKMDEGTYVSIDYIKSKIANLKTQNYFKTRKSAETPLTKIQNKKFDDTVTGGFFRTESDAFILTPYTKTLPESKTIEVWRARIQFMHGFLAYFYEMSIQGIVHVIFNEIKFKYPDVETMKIDIPSNTMSRLGEMERFRKSSRKLVGIEMKKIMEEAKSSGSEGKKKKEEQVKHVPAEKKTKKAPEAPKPQKKSDSEDLKNLNTSSENLEDVNYWSSLQDKWKAMVEAKEGEEKEKLLEKLFVNREGVALKLEMLTRSKEYEMDDAINKYLSSKSAANEAKKSEGVVKKQEEQVKQVEKKTPEAPKSKLNPEFSINNEGTNLKMEILEKENQISDLMETNWKLFEERDGLDAKLYEKDLEIQKKNLELAEIKKENQKASGDLETMKLEFSMKMGKKEEEIEEMKKNHEKAEKEFKFKSAELEEKEKETQRNLTIAQDQLLDKISELEAQLEKEKNLEDSEFQNPPEISEMKKVNKELHESNIRLLALNEEKERTIQCLLDRIISK